MLARTLAADHVAKALTATVSGQGLAITELQQQMTQQTALAQVHGVQLGRMALSATVRLPAVSVPAPLSPRFQLVPELRFCPGPLPAAPPIGCALAIEDARSPFAECGGVMPRRSAGVARTALGELSASELGERDGSNERQPDFSLPPPPCTDETGARSKSVSYTPLSPVARWVERNG